MSLSPFADDAGHADFVRIDAGGFFLPQSDQFAQPRHIGVDIQASSVALRFPYGFCQRIHHIVFGAYPIAAVACAELSVYGADAGRLVDGCLFLQGEMQRHMQEGIGFAIFGRPGFVQIVFDVFEIAGVFGMGFDNPQGFLLQAVQLQGGEALSPDMGEKTADIVCVDIVHGGNFRNSDRVII